MNGGDKNFIMVFFNQVIINIKTLIDNIKYNKHVLHGIFYIIIFYFIFIGIYFFLNFIYKMYYIIKNLLLDNEFIVNLDLLSNNCVIDGVYPTNKKVNELDNTISTDLNTGEKIKTINGIPVQYLNTNLNTYIDLILADFYWASSYKTYIPSGINRSKPTYEAIKQAFTKFNVRSVYLDVYSNSTTIGDVDAIPIVKTDLLYYNFKALDFLNCLEVIKRYGWYDESTSSMPIILYLNLNFNSDSIMYEKIYYALMKVFWNHLLDKKYSFAGRSNIFPVGKVLMKDTIGKIVIISNVYPTRTKLDEIINGYSNSANISYCYISNNTIDQKDYGGLTVTSSSTDLINNHKTNIEFIYSDNLINTSNVSNSKVDLSNPNFNDCIQYGVQFIMMSLFLPDSNLNDWYKFFKQNNFKMVLKQKTLRYIETNNSTLVQQNPLLNFTTSTYNMPVSGFFSTQKSGINI